MYYIFYFCARCFNHCKLRINANRYSVFHEMSRLWFQSGRPKTCIFELKCTVSVVILALIVESVFIKTSQCQSKALEGCVFNYAHLNSLQLSRLDIFEQAKNYWNILLHFFVSSVISFFPFCGRFTLDTVESHHLDSF